MDSIPIAGSSNTVTSDGIKTAIDNAVTKNQKNIILIQDSYGANNGNGTTISNTMTWETSENDHGIWVLLNVRFTPKTTENPTVYIQYKSLYSCDAMKLI